MSGARGRMLAWRISQSRKVNALPGWGPMLLYTWMIPHYDNLGRQLGEPIQVKSNVFPRRPDITLDLIEEWLTELDRVGLVYWYEVDGMRFLSMPATVWEREQRLHNHMSRASALPPVTEGVRKSYVPPPEYLRDEGKGGGSELEVELERKKPSQTPSPDDAPTESKTVRTRTGSINGHDPGPAFWNSPDTQLKLARLKATGTPDADARRLILAAERTGA
jgi:hypothetical protein